MLEEIHSCCPQLEHIELEGGLLRDPIIDDAETIAPANQMREFRLRCSHGWSRYQFWLRFFALKYPNLETLELDNRYGIITLRREDEELRLQEHQCFQLLAHHCRRLRNIRTNHISLDPRFFESLSSYQTHLTTLFLHNVWRHGRKTIIAAIECARNTLHTLSLTIPGNLDKEQLLPLLGTCHRLTNLNIADFDRFEPETFQIDEILDHCKGLQTLEIRQVTVLSYDGKETAQRQHPLTSLKLEEIMFNQNVLDSLSNLCPNLRELSLISCCRVDCTDDMNIEIHLPQHNLRSVTLRDVQHRYFTDRIKYFGLKTQNEEIWCHTSHVKVGRKIVPTAKFFTGNEAELLKEKITDPHSSCSYAKKLRSSGGKALGWSFEELLRGYLSIYCFSLNSLVVNDARLV
ncbi:hypothetical protein DFQ30_011049 [Apophysomyces sp. BC1015]|nr:hypothetical protein DFQ30_011049 [Apophysomyces sp. BC1015]